MARRGYTPEQIIIKLREAGLPHNRFHDLRHTHAMLLPAGVDAEVVHTRLGHVSVAFTMDTCAHVLPEMQETVAESFGRLLASNTAVSGVETQLNRERRGLTKCCQVLSKVSTNNMN